MSVNLNSTKIEEKPPISFTYTYAWKISSTAIIHIFLIPWMIYYLIRNRMSPIILAYTNLPFSKDLSPNLSKYSLFEKIQSSNPSIGNLIPKTILVISSLSYEQKINSVLNFLKTNMLSYPIIAKPDEGTRSIGAFLVKNEEALEWLLKGIDVNYLIQKYHSDPIEAGLYFIRSTNFEHPSQYGVAIKYDVYGDLKTPHQGLVSLRSKFLCADLTSKLTPELEKVIVETASAVPFDMGRIDVVVPSINDLFSRPEQTLKILEVNTGFDTIDLHSADLKYSFMERLRLIKDKWQYALEIGKVNYLNTTYRIGFGRFFVKYLKYGFFLNSIRNRFRGVKN